MDTGPTTGQTTTSGRIALMSINSSSTFPLTHCLFTVNVHGYYTQAILFPRCDLAMNGPFFLQASRVMATTHTEPHWRSLELDDENDVHIFMKDWELKPQQGIVLYQALVIILCSTWMKFTMKSILINSFSILFHNCSNYITFQKLIYYAKLMYLY